MRNLISLPCGFYDRAFILDGLAVADLTDDGETIDPEDALAHVTSARVETISPDALDLTCDWYQEHADILETDALVPERY